MKEVYDILYTNIFKALINNSNLQITQLTAALSLLIKSNIAFDLTFYPSTPRESARAHLNIYIKQGVTLKIEIGFDSGDLFYSPP